MIQKFSNIDEYIYRFENNSGSGDPERISMTTKEDIVCTVKLNSTGEIRSEYSIFGIHLGDSRAAAEAFGKEYFGEDGTLSENTGIETLYFGDESDDKGLLIITMDPKSDSVRSVSYMKSIDA